MNIIDAIYYKSLVISFNQLQFESKEIHYDPRDRSFYQIGLRSYNQRFAIPVIPVGCKLKPMGHSGVFSLRLDGEKGYTCYASDLDLNDDDFEKYPSDTEVDCLNEDNDRHNENLRDDAFQLNKNIRYNIIDIRAYLNR